MTFATFTALWIAGSFALMLVSNFIAWRTWRDARRRLEDK